MDGFDPKVVKAVRQFQNRDRHNAMIEMARWDSRIAVTPDQLDADPMLLNVAKQIQGKCLCALGDFAANPVLSSLKLFRDEYMTYVAPPEPAKPAAPKTAARPAPKAAAVAGGD